MYCKSVVSVISKHFIVSDQCFFLLFSVLCADNDQAVAVRSQFQQIVRALYSSPPVHGILLVSTILNDPELKKLWEAELEVNKIHTFNEYLPFIYILICFSHSECDVCLRSSQTGCSK